MGWRAPARTTGRAGSRPGCGSAASASPTPTFPIRSILTPPIGQRALDDELALLDEPIVLCHSLACLLWLRAAAGRHGVRSPRACYSSRRPGGDDLEPVARFLDHGARASDVSRAAGETLIVCSDDDPYCPPGAVATYAEPLGIPAHVIAGAATSTPTPATASGRTWRAGRSGRTPFPVYTRPQSRACGGIGRRARLRALWAVWPVGVRVSLGASQASTGGACASWPRSLRAPLQRFLLSRGARHASNAAARTPVPLRSRQAYSTRCASLRAAGVGLLRGYSDASLTAGTWRRRHRPGPRQRRRQ